MIFDTSFIIDAMRNNEQARKKLEEIISGGKLQIITTPTIFELYSGVAQSEKTELEKKKIIHTISNLITWHLDNLAAEKGGEIHGKLIKDGQPIDSIDCMIAAITIISGEKLLTKNIKHFSRISGLEIETY